MLETLFKYYRYVFARKRFFRFNKFLYELGSRGIGIRNYEDDYISGEAHFIRSVTRRNPLLVLDIGANTGNYSKRILQDNPQARIYALEPHPDNFRKLSSAIDHAGFTAINSAAGAKPGHLVLYDYDQSEGSQHASIYKEVIEDIHAASSRKLEVEVTTVDSLVKHEAIEKIHLLKIDVEGNEFQVLLGARETLARDMIDIIHFEFNEMNVVSRTFFKDFIDLLTEYRFFRMLPDGLIPLGQYRAASHEIFSYQNIVAVNINTEFTNLV